jgi:AMMECR1 domain-containing protein
MSTDYTRRELQSIIEFARNALETLIKEGQNMDIGSVPDILNQKAGVVVRLEKQGSFTRLRGRGCCLNTQQMSKSIIEAIGIAASDRSTGSAIKKYELDDIIIRMSPIEEMYVTQNPCEDIDVGCMFPVVSNNKKIEWMYPKVPTTREWNSETFIYRTYEKLGLSPQEHIGETICIAKSRPIKETKKGTVVFD